MTKFKNVIMLRLQYESELNSYIVMLLQWINDNCKDSNLLCDGHPIAQQHKICKNIQNLADAALEKFKK